MAHSRSTVAALPLNDRLVAGVLALFLGAALVFGAGLANSTALHDTAHDVRHSFGFPCH
ncbi:CbtB-domain containing protein [Rhizobium sp. YIM 134829]|uniref:CbtB domain-containing protein n=1 Tax=Rhizobium sp. YIM 134829 TaxID=3390453 RepID=UPI00397D61FE